MSLDRSMEELGLVLLDKSVEELGQVLLERLLKELRLVTFGRSVKGISRINSMDQQSKSASNFSEKERQQTR